jgi:DNA-binding GntR family transcriptional regulator
LANVYDYVYNIFGVKPLRERTRSGLGANAEPIEAMQKTISVFEGENGLAHTASERAYAEMRRRILDGRLPAGMKLKETQLANELGISRTPVRDALSRLTVEGLLDFRPNVGATVAVWSESQIEHVFRIRSMLEPYASELAASQILDEEVEELRELCVIMERAAKRETQKDLDALAAANGRFHRLIIDAARSDHLTRLITIASDAPLSLRIFSRYSAEEVQRSMRHHREVIDALAVRDPAWAASAMRTHILSSIGTARGTRIADENDHAARRSAGRT